MIFYEEDKNKYEILPGKKLKEEQVDAIDFMLHKFNCIVNLSTGTGKTSAVLIACYKIMSKTRDTVTFIICPKQANTAFKKELKALSFKFSISVTGEKNYEKGSRFFIFNYSNLGDMITLLNNLKDRGFRIVGVFDEAHTLGNPESQVTQTLSSVRNKFSACYSLTATPLLNKPEGLWSLCNFTCPGKIGSWYEFKNNWLDVRERQIRVRGGRTRKIEDIVGYVNLPDLRNKLEEFIITRTYEYPLKFYYRDCTLTEEELDIYNLAANGVLNGLEEKQEDYAPRLWNLQRVADGCDEKSRALGTTSKQKLLVKVVKEIMSRGEGVLIYTSLEDTYTRIEEVFKQYRGYLGYRRLWFINGKIDYKKRVECEKSLRAGDIVILTQAGSKSINLQAVNNLIFFDIPFAVGESTQCIGRIARVDSVYDVQNVYFLEAKDTIDTYKRMLMQSNMSIIQSIFGKSKNMPCYIDVDKDAMKKYRQYFKNTMLWKR